MRIRRIGAEERVTTTFPLQAYAFEGSPLSAAEEEKFRDYARYHDGNVTLAVEESGSVVASATAIPMRQNVRGSTYPMAGIAGVATHPLARRRGHVRALLTQLLGEMRDGGHVVSALYPFRPSFYERFGYASLPKSRRVTFSPAGLAALQRADLPGEVHLERIKDGYDAYREFTLRLLDQWHGFAVFPDYRALRLRDENRHWLATARVAGEVVGAVPYRITDHGGDLVGDALLTTSPLGRALLLQFFARHVDQVTRVTVTVTPDELPELWVTDLEPVTEARVASPGMNAPMVRVLSVEGLAGMAAGPGRVSVSVAGDPFVAGEYLLDGTSGKLEVVRGNGTAAGARLTVAGLSALVYGVLDPEDVVIRGWGAVPHDAAVELRSLFPRRNPFIFADF
ncbi:MAG: GNAT family N-acetyltransferase [Micromonosporaceae bacterium]|nr:GNAT family N-acetyltransferase [Micromonosporaceae bacterium]